MHRSISADNNKRFNCSFIIERMYLFDQFLSMTFVVGMITDNIRFFKYICFFQTLIYFLCFTITSCRINNKYVHFKVLLDHYNSYYVAHLSTQDGGLQLFDNDLTALPYPLIEHFLKMKLKPFFVRTT